MRKTACDVDLHGQQELLIRKICLVCAYELILQGSFCPQTSEYRLCRGCLVLVGMCQGVLSDVVNWSVSWNAQKVCHQPRIPNPSTSRLTLLPCDRFSYHLSLSFASDSSLTPRRSGKRKMHAAVKAADTKISGVSVLAKTLTYSFAPTIALT